MPLGFSHPKTCAHVRLLGPCFKTGQMKPYGRQQPRCIVCVDLLYDPKQFRRTASSPPWSTSSQEKDASPSEEEHAPFASAMSELATTRAITTRIETRAYLPEWPITQTKQLLTRPDEKCDEHKTRPYSDSPFGSIHCTSSQATA